MKKSRKMQKSSSFISRSDRSTSDHNNSRLQHSINSSANSDSEDTSSHIYEAGGRTTDSLRSVSGKYSPIPTTIASNSSDASDAGRKKESGGSGSFRIPGSRSRDSGDSHIAASLLAASSGSTRGKDGSSIRITQRENGSVRIVHQERSVRIIDTAIPENDTLVPTLDPLNGGHIEPVEDVEACKFHKREVVHDSTIEGLKTLGMVLGKTTNQVVSSLMSAQSPGLSAQKVMVVPVDSEMMQKLTAAEAEGNETKIDS